VKIEDLRSDIRKGTITVTESLAKYKGLSRTTLYALMAEGVIRFSHPPKTRNRLMIEVDIIKYVEESMGIERTIGAM